MSEIDDLAKDFGKASAKVASALYTVYKESGDAFAADWRANAVSTSGRTGHEYPPTIDSETKVSWGIHVTTGPNPNLGRPALAGRGYEFGSRNQPAHLDGLHAMPLAERRLERAADAAIAFLLP